MFYLLLKPIIHTYAELVLQCQSEDKEIDVEYRDWWWWSCETHRYRYIHFKDTRADRMWLYCWLGEDWSECDIYEGCCTEIENIHCFMCDWNRIMQNLEQEQRGHQAHWISYDIGQVFHFRLPLKSTGRVNLHNNVRKWKGNASWDICKETALNLSCETKIWLWVVTDGVQIQGSLRPCTLTSISVISPAYHRAGSSSQPKTDLWKGQHATAETEQCLIRGEMVSFPNWFQFGSDKIVLCWAT